MTSTPSHQVVDTAPIIFLRRDDGARQGNLALARLATADGRREIDKPELDGFLYFRTRSPSKARTDTRVATVP